MNKINQQTITVEVARLIIEFLYNNTDRTKKLDQWICQSKENEEIFSWLTDKVDDQVFDPNQLVIETETVIDLWIIAGLIVRHQKGLNNEFEEYYLNNWANADVQNRKLFTNLQNPAYMQQMLAWNRLKRDEMNL